MKEYLVENDIFIRNGNEVHLTDFILFLIFTQNKEGSLKKFVF